jgi:hypothetical protein
MDYNQVLHSTCDNNSRWIRCTGPCNGCEAVAVLPQASTAVNVLVLEAEHDVVDIAPSLDVTDALLQPSMQ